MRSSISVILGDVHIGRSLSLGKPGIGAALNSRIIDQLNLLDWTLDRAVDFNADNIIITGDVFEEQKPHPTLVSLFLSWLKKCVSHNVKIHIVVGNHDILRNGQFQMSALDIIANAEIEGVAIYNQISTVHTNGASFTFMPFRDRRSFNTDSHNEALSLLGGMIPYELSEIEANQYKVLIGHLTIKGSLPVGDEIDDMMNELICLPEMFAGYDYVWMGHIHKPQIISTNPYIAHIGSMDLSNFGETDHTKAILVFNPDEEVPFRYVELPTRPLRQISISVPATINDSTQFVLQQINIHKNNIQKSIVKLDVALDNVKSPPIDRKLIEETLISHGAFHIAKINEEKKIGVVKKNQNENIDNTMTELAAIKMYAEDNVEEQKRLDFVGLASSILKEYQADTK